MRLTALLLALAFQVLPFRFWNGLVLCLHPDGRGVVESAADNCCRPCDAGGTHCDTDPASSHEDDDARAGETHCEDIPLVGCALVAHEKARDTVDARPEPGPAVATRDVDPAPGVGPRSAAPPAGGLAPPDTLTRLRPAVLRC
jgi:hypothetical protein